VVRKLASGEFVLLLSILVRICRARVHGWGGRQRVREGNEMRV
jgi:hypothetical protein